MLDETSRPLPAYPPGPLGLVQLIERSIVLLLVVGLLIGVGAVLRPFTTAILFGATLSIAAWPLRQIMIGLGLSRGLTAMALLILSIIGVGLPILLMAPVLVDQTGYVINRAQLFLAEMPARPASLEAVPVVGGRLVQIWDELAKAEGNLTVALAPYSATVREMLVTAARGLADSVVQVALALIVATMFWVRGDVLISELDDIFLRLGGRTAEETLETAAGAVRSVAYGVIGTAIIQAALLTLGLAIAGIQGAATLGFVGLLLATSQIGAPLLLLIWGGAAWWLFRQGETGWGVFMVAWGLMVSTIDNIIKPWLIGMGVDMPLSLTILGVFGGFIAFGFLGLFIGPTLIAVTLVLLHAWRAQAPVAREGIE